MKEPLEFVFYDCETTGLQPESDRIIELAALKANGQSFCEFVNPKRPIPPDSTAIHGIKDADVASAKDFANVGAAFLEFCGPQAVLVAHNNDTFDILFVKAECARASIALPPLRTIDSLKWARRYRPDLPRHPLQYLREIYKIPANTAHRALDDCLVLMKVFFAMIDDLNPDQILALMSNPAKSATLTAETMPFGKHQGKPLSSLPDSYVRWLLKEGALDKPDNAALKSALTQLGKL